MSQSYIANSEAASSGLFLLLDRMVFVLGFHLSMNVYPCFAITVVC